MNQRHPPKSTSNRSSLAVFRQCCDSRPTHWPLNFAPGSRLGEIDCGVSRPGSPGKGDDHVQQNCLSITVVIGVASAALAGPKDPAWPTTNKSGAPTQER